MGNIKRKSQITKEIEIFRMEMPKTIVIHFYIGPIILGRKCNRSPKNKIKNHLIFAIIFKIHNCCGKEPKTIYYQAID